jgi:hypothetical protein
MFPSLHFFGHHFNAQIPSLYPIALLCGITQANGGRRSAHGSKPEWRQAVGERTYEYALDPQPRKLRLITRLSVCDLLGAKPGLAEPDKFPKAIDLP